MTVCGHFSREDLTFGDTIKQTLDHYMQCVVVRVRLNAVFLNFGDTKITERKYSINVYSALHSPFEVWDPIVFSYDNADIPSVLFDNLLLLYMR